MTAPDAQTVLEQSFGLREFRQAQREVIDHLLAGRSAAAVFPTGGGKSLCYQLPALCLSGLTIVVSPLIALMKDQIDALRARGIAASRLDSSLDLDEYRAVIDDARSGALRLLYVAPERFNNERFRGMIAALDIALFAVDEAHCISEWGHNFRPDYLKLAFYARMCGSRRILALTATATPRVLDDICRELSIDAACAVVTGTYRDNLTLLTTPTERKCRNATLTERITTRPRGPTIVYVTLQRGAEVVAQALIDRGLPARAYHAGLANDVRTAIQNWFMAGEHNIVVATIAFGMGIDKADIRYVYHFNLPKSLEGYSQEIGRAGRDGLPATCEMLGDRDDLNVLENFVFGDTPTATAVRTVLDVVFGEAEDFDLSVQSLATQADTRILVVRTLLTYLELDGYLQGGTPIYSTYRFQPQCSSQEIFAQVPPEQAKLLAGLFRQAKKGRTWFTLDLEAAAKRNDVARGDAVRALDDLAARQLLVVEAAGVRHRFKRLHRPDDLDALTADLYGRMQKREADEVARLGQITGWIESDSCQTNALCDHFGDTREAPCGHCSRCLDDRPAQLSPRRAGAIDEVTWSRALALRKQRPETLSDPRSLTRMLCGVTSPRLTKERLSRDELFGALADVPFGDVLARASAPSG